MGKQDSLRDSSSGAANLRVRTDIRTGLRRTPEIEGESPKKRTQHRIPSCARTTPNPSVPGLIPSNAAFIAFFSCSVRLLEYLKSESYRQPLAGFHMTGSPLQSLVFPARRRSGKGARLAMTFGFATVIAFGMSLEFLAQLFVWRNWPVREILQGWL